MAKKANAKAKLEKVIQKVLDSTELDEKLISEYKGNQSLYDMIVCYITCYGGYLLAVGAGCLFGASLLWGTIFLIGASVWAYKVRNCKPCCQGGVCESK
tara:strand:- start:1989 stop:2285 length:297 start_codon:yes stop_codon:yes gene_type:complete